MKRRAFLSGAVMAPIMGALQSAETTREMPTGDGPIFPNFLFIVFDMCRFDAIGANGVKGLHTPNVDWLASTGVRFTNCYTPQALCAPARASILTGLYPHAHRLRKNPYPFANSLGIGAYPEPVYNPFQNERFSLWENFPFLLHSAGYETAHIGKWHLGESNPGFFDTWKSFNSGLKHWVGVPHQSSYRPDVHTTQGVEFLERNASRPFLLYQSYYPPNLEPNDPPKAYMDLFQGKDIEHPEYHASVANLDANVGRLIETLRKHNILDRTFIIVTADHGMEWGARPGTFERLGHCVAYEGASHIPLIMRYPPLLSQGTTWQAGVSLLDLMPTILDVAHILPYNTPTARGHSLLPELREGRNEWRYPLILQNVPQMGIDGSYYDERAVVMMIAGQKWKLILRKFEAGDRLRPGELYNVSSDPTERANLYREQVPMLKTLATMLHDWGERVGDSLAVELGRYAQGG